MAAAATKLLAKSKTKPTEAGSELRTWWPMEGLRREIDRLFDDFDRDLFGFPFRPRCSPSSHFGAAN